MKKKLISTFILIAAALLSGCTHYYYVANVQNVPIFREENETRFSGSFGGGDYSECIEFQAAYSLSDKIGIMGNYMHAKGGDATEDDYAKGNHFDVALGYYKPVNEYFVFEMYGGLGGSAQHHEYEFGSKSDLSAFKLYIQPAVGLTTNFLEVAVSTRINHLSFGQAKMYGGLPEYDYIFLNEISDKNFFIMEPAVTFRFGLKNVKFQIQGQYVWAVNPIRDFHEEYHFSGGVVVYFGERFKR